MKRIVTLTTASAICALFATSLAQAEDYNSGIVTKAPSEVYTDVEFGSGWYLRGDISYNFDGNNENEDVTLPAVGSSLQADYDDAIGVSVGFGSYLSSNFRVEANLASIFDSSFSGSSTATFGGIDTGAGNAVVTTGGTREIEADYSAATLMVSGNLDLGRFGAFTPYIGAGAGIARIEYNETETLTCTPFSTTVACTSGPVAGVGEVATSTATNNEASWTYAYQLTAGTAVALNERTSLDVSYSFTQIGDGDTINYADGTAIDQDGVRLHQMKAGVRYNLY